jgi:hypothetical protein
MRPHETFEVYLGSGEGNARRLGSLGILGLGSEPGAEVVSMHVGAGFD